MWIKGLCGSHLKIDVHTGEELTEVLRAVRNDTYLVDISKNMPAIVEQKLHTSLDIQPGIVIS